MKLEKSNDRYVITNNGRGQVSVLDINPDYTDENLEIFWVDFEDNEEVGNYLSDNLEDMIRLMNEQDKELKKHGISL